MKNRDHLPLLTEVRLVRDECGISLHAAKRAVMERRMLSDIDRARSLDDVKHVLRAMVEAVWGAKG